jgi:ADYC domain
MTRPTPFALTSLAFGLTVGLASGGCVPPDSDEKAGLPQGESSQLLSSKCPSHICGMNSAELSNGGFFYDLNLDGLANSDGYSLISARKGSAVYDVAVSGGRITATLSYGVVGSPQTLSGYSLAGLEMRLKKILPDGTASYRTLVIDAVSRTTDYWAKPVDVSAPPTPKIETYKFFIKLDSGFGAYLCQNGAEFVDPTSPVRAMPAHHALVFEGERIDIESLTIAPQLNTRWFNIGCAETALAKLQLTGHTKAAYHHADFVTSIAERQTMLKMLTADYCGTGNSFTVSGQPLRWTDDKGTMTISSSFPKVLEARWTPNGAACLNTPRVDAHPSDASREVFEWGAAFEIADECAIPSCGATTSTYHLRSWNPTPFTN